MSARQCQALDKEWATAQCGQGLAADETGRAITANCKDQRSFALIPCARTLAQNPRVCQRGFYMLN